LNCELHPVLGQLLDGRLHQSIRAKGLMSRPLMRVIILSRHGESTLNVEGRVNGDPTVPVALTEAGREAAQRLGAQLANLPIELGVHTRFARTRETLELALAGRDVPVKAE